MKVSKFLKDLITTGLSQVGIIIFSILMLRFFAVALSQEQFGIFMLVRRWISVLVPVVTLNLSIGLVRYVSYEKEKARYHLWISLMTSLGISILAFILFSLFGKAFSVLFFNSPGYSGLVSVQGIFLFANVLHLVAYSYFRGKMEMGKANVLRTLFFGFPAFLAFVLMVMKIKNYSTILYAFFLIYSVWGLATNFYYLRNEISFGDFKVYLKDKLAGNLKKSRDLYWYSLARIPAFVASQLIFGFPAIIAAHKLSIKAAGYLGIVVEIIRVLEIFSLPFNMIFLPKFSELISGKKTENIRHYCTVVLDFIFTFLPLVAVMLVGMVRLIIYLWFGPSYLVIGKSAAATILFSVFFLAFALIRGILDGLFVFPYVNWISIAGLGVMVVLSLLAGSGVFELALAFGAGLFVLGLVSIWILVQKLHIPLRQLSKILGKALVICGLVFLVLEFVDAGFAGMKLRYWYDAGARVLCRALLFFILWWFYWRKTLWYSEMLKRIQPHGGGASGGQGLFLKKPPLDPTKTFV